MKISQQECFEVYDSTVNSYTFFYFHSEKEKICTHTYVKVTVWIIYIYLGSMLYLVFQDLNRIEKNKETYTTYY